MQALENLAGTGQLIPEPTSVEEISVFSIRVATLPDTTAARLSPRTAELL